MTKKIIFIFIFTVTTIMVCLNGVENEVVAIERELVNETVKALETNNNEELNNIYESPILIRARAKESKVKPIVNNKKSKEEIQEELNKKVMESMLTMTINGNLVFETGNSWGLLGIENDSRNLHSIQVEIHIQENDELVYTSKVLGVGETIEKDFLNIPLEKGEYHAIATFTSIDEETNTIIGKGKINILLTVEM